MLRTAIAPGCMRICTASRVIWTMQPTGIVALAARRQPRRCPSSGRVWRTRFWPAAERELDPAGLFRLRGSGCDRRQILIAVDGGLAHVLAAVEQEYDD